MESTPLRMLRRWPGGTMPRPAALVRMAEEQLEQWSRVEGAATVLKLASGGTLNTTVHQADLSTGIARVAGYLESLAAINDVVIAGTGADATAYGLDGAPADALSGDGKARRVVALVALQVDEDGEPDGLGVRFVLGDEDDTGQETAPTEQELRDALETDATVDPRCFVIASRATLSRSGTTVTLGSVVDAASNAAHAIERLRGVVLAATPAE